MAERLIAPPPQSKAVYSDSSYQAHVGCEGYILRVIFIFQKSGLKPPTSVGKDPTVRRRRSKPLNPSTLVGGGSVNQNGNQSVKRIKSAAYIRICNLRSKSYQGFVAPTAVLSRSCKSEQYFYWAIFLGTLLSRAHLHVSDFADKATA